MIAVNLTIRLCRQLTIVFACLALSAVGPAAAHTPVEFLEVFSGQPATATVHPIDVKSVLDAERRTIELEGPRYFSSSVGALNRAAKKPTAHLSWYQISEPAPAERRDIAVLDLVRGMQAEPLSIGAVEFFLSPAQRITSGAPDPIPDGLDHFMAYRIHDAGAVEVTSKLSNGSASASSERKLATPRFLCVPAEEWHHEEYFEVTHPSTCFVVYELDEQASDQSIALIDQFGLNQFATKKSQWLCVTGALSSR